MIGEKVICVDDMKNLAAGSRTYRGELLPGKGKPYTIRTFEHTPQGAVIRLEEVVNPKRTYADGFGECRFNLNHFRFPDDGYAERVLEKVIVDSEELVTFILPQRSCSIKEVQL